MCATSDEFCASVRTNEVNVDEPTKVKDGSFGQIADGLVALFNFSRFARILRILMCSQRVRL